VILWRSPLVIHNPSAKSFPLFTRNLHSSLGRGDGQLGHTITEESGPPTWGFRIGSTFSAARSGPIVNDSRPLSIKFRMSSQIRPTGSESVILGLLQHSPAVRGRTGWSQQPAEETFAT